MDLNRTNRLAGPDVVRAVALIGVVVMNYHGYLIGRSGAIGSGWADDLFNPFSGPLSTRFAATFVLVAGVGVTLMTLSSLADPERVTAMRWRLLRRGTLLYVVGLLVDVIWPGTILPYYGVLFATSAVLFTLRARWLILAGAGAALGAWALKTWQLERSQDGRSTNWLSAPRENSIRRYVFDMMINGTHPVLPWLAFLCAGMVLGRVLRTDWWRTAAAGVGLTMFAIAALASDAATTSYQGAVLSTRPYDRGMMYVMSALGSALVAYAAIDWVATRFPSFTDPLRRAGQMTLTLYLLHIFVFNLVVDWFGWIEPGGLDTALMFALGFWVVAIGAANWWSRRFGIGPAERIYRGFGG